MLKGLVRLTQASGALNFFMLQHAPAVSIFNRRARDKLLHLFKGHIEEPLILVHAAVCMKTDRKKYGGLFETHEGAVLKKVSRSVSD